MFDHEQHEEAAPDRADRGAVRANLRARDALDEHLHGLAPAAGCLAQFFISEGIGPSSVAETRNVTPGRPVWSPRSTRLWSPVAGDGGPQANRPSSPEGPLATMVPVAADGAGPPETDRGQLA